MRYAVLGTGGVGQAIAGKLVALGHEVAMGTRDPAASLSRTEPGLGGAPPVAQWLAERTRVRLVPFTEAAAFGETIVNATNGQASLAALEAAGADHLARKVLIDIANPLDFSRGFPPVLDPVNTDSLAEQIQLAFPETRVVKTLMTVNSAVMVDPARVPGRHDMFVSGNDADAKAAVTALLMEFGWPADDIIDLGDITCARGQEMLLPLWLRLYAALGDTDFNIHVARRQSDSDPA